MPKKLNLSYYALGITSLTIIAACGGGGSSPAPAPSPTPPSSPAGPTAIAEADRAVVDERQRLDIVASQSSDPSGGALTYTIEQISGPDLGNPIGNGPVWTFDTPEVDADTAVSFRVTVTNNGTNLSDTAEASATIANFDRSPASPQWVGEYGSFTLSNSRLLSFDNSPLLSDDDRLVFTDQDGSLNTANFETNPANTAGLLDQATLRTQTGSYEVLFDDINRDTQTDAIVLDRNTDQIYLYRQTLDNADGFVFEEASTGNIPGACAFASTVIGNDSIDANRNTFPGLFIGTEDEGFSILENQGNPRPVIPTAESRDRAGRLSVPRAISTNERGCYLAIGTFDTVGTFDIWAYDEQRSELLQIRNPLTTNLTIGNTIQLGFSDQNTRLIDMQFGVGQGGQSFLAMLLTGGHYDSNFLLILQDSPGGISETRIDLPHGSGTDLLVESMDVLPFPPSSTTSDFDSDILIAVPETPYVYVLENLSTMTGPVTFSEISYLETGFGVYKIGLVSGNNSLGRELATATKEGEVRLFLNTE
jgi:hypothetical protein